jgi:XRE family transcriptional regulator, regulator of sulfur utilization
VAKDLLVAIGDRVRELRTEAGLSQEALAHRLRLHRNYVGLVERGERSLSLETLARVARTLGVSLAEFFAPFQKR